MRALCVSAAVALLAVMGIGCQAERTTGLDEEIPMAEPQPQPTPQAQREEGGPLDFLAFWKWGQPAEEEQQQAAAAQPAPQYQEEEEGGPLDFLAFWKWGKDEQPRQPEPPRVSERQILGNLSPEMSTRDDTPAEVDIKVSRTLDYNGRQAWDDVLNFLLLDRPNRLSLVPTP